MAAKIPPIKPIATTIGVAILAGAALPMLVAELKIFATTKEKALISPATAV